MKGKNKVFFSQNLVIGLVGWKERKSEGKKQQQEMKRTICNDLGKATLKKGFG